MTISKILFSSAMALSLSAFASPDFSVLSQVKPEIFEAKSGDLQKCFGEAWKSSQTTTEQDTKAKDFVNGAKTIVDQHTDAIKAEAKALQAAWEVHPIVRDTVVTAEDGLKKEAEPVLEAVRDAAINVINLLTLDQRKVFNESLKTCLQQ